VGIRWATTAGWWCHGLNLSGVGARDAGVAMLVRAFEDAARALVLHSLDLSDNNLTVASAASLGQLLAARTSEVRELRLAHNRLSDSGAAALALGLQRNTSLLKLSLGHNGIRARGVQEIASALALHESLAELSLADNALQGPVGCEAIRQLLTHARSLQQLPLGGNKLGVQIFATLGELKPPPHPTSRLVRLRSLGLERTASGLAGCHAAILIAASQLALEQLYLGGNRLRDDAAVALATSLRSNRTLLRLGLDNNLIGDEGARTLLSGALEGGTLQLLALEHNSVTAAQSEFIEGATRNTRLRIRL